MPIIEIIVVAKIETSVSEATKYVIPKVIATATTACSSGTDAATAAPNSASRHEHERQRGDRLGRARGRSS